MRSMSGGELGRALRAVYANRSTSVIYTEYHVYTMPLVTVRVDEDLKRRMDGLQINWSEAIRGAIARIVEERVHRNRARAAQLMDRIRVPSPKGFDSTRFIREWREARYGSRGRR